MVVIAITGHQHIPEQAFEYVRDGLGRFLDTYLGLGKQVTAVSCLAVGADQLFANEALNRGFNLKAINACKNIESTFDGQGLAEYRRLLAATFESDTMLYDESSPEAYLVASEHMIDISDVVVALWDGQPGSPGGTGDAVSYARSQGKPVVLIWPEGVLH